MAANKTNDIDWQLWKQQILDVLDPAEVAGEFVQAIRNAPNQEIQGECPFPHDGSPGPDTKKRWYMGLKPDKNYPWHCFRCLEKGNIFSLVARMRNVGMGEAIRYLADRYGVPAPESLGIASEGVTETVITDYLSEVMHFSHGALVGTAKRPPHQAGLSYMFERGFPEAAIRQFHIGVLKIPQRPTRGREEVQIASGLYRRKDDGSIRPVFADERIVIPVMRGDRVVNLVNRSMDPSEDRFKYINMRPIRYHFNQHRLQEPEAYVVEGQLDAIALELMGLPACAILGSSNIREWTGQKFGVDTYVHLLFDGDDAGRKATRKMAQALFSAGRWCVDVVGFEPDANDKKVDAAEYLKRNNGASRERFLADAGVRRTDVITWLLRDAGYREGDGWAETIRSVTPVLNMVTGLGALPREAYLHQLSKATGLEVEAMRAHVREHGAWKEIDEALNYTENAED